MGITTEAASLHGSPFPTTRWTLIREAADRKASACQKSLESLAVSYWRPVYAYFRRKWGKADEDAKELTQEFFAVLCEKDFLQDLSPEHGRFRSYVMAALDNFVRLQHRQASSLKRGGGHTILSLGGLEGFEPPAEGTPEDAFLVEWARAVLEDALTDLEAESRVAGNEPGFQILMLRDVQAPRDQDLSYEALARRFGVSVVDVSNSLSRGRKRLRELILARIRDTVSSEKDAVAEMRQLFEKRP